MTRLRANKRCKFVLSTLSVEKLSSPKMPEKTFALGCPTNDLLSFPDIFYPPDFGIFGAKLDFFNRHGRKRQSPLCHTSQRSQSRRYRRCHEKLQQSEKALEQATVPIGHKLGHGPRKARYGFPLESVQGLCGMKYAQLYAKTVQSALKWWSIRWSDRFAIGNSGII